VAGVGEAVIAALTRCFPLIIITATLRAGACKVATLVTVHAQIIGLSVASLLVGEWAPSARRDVHGTRVGPHGSRVAARVGVAGGSGGDPSDTTLRILAILLSLSPRIVEANAERNILVERVREVPSDVKILNLRSEATAKGGNLRVFAPVKGSHVADETSIVRGTWFGALLEVEEHALRGGFLVRVLERGSEPLHELWMVSWFTCGVNYFLAASRRRAPALEILALSLRKAASSLLNTRCSCTTKSANLSHSPLKVSGLFILASLLEALDDPDPEAGTLVVATVSE
jgi:hypothetical protein